MDSPRPCPHYKMTGMQVEGESIYFSPFTFYLKFRYIVLKSAFLFAN